MNEYVWLYDWYRGINRPKSTVVEWVVDEDGDVFTSFLCPNGKPVDPKHIRRDAVIATNVLLYYPPLDTMAPPERKTVYVDVMATTPEGITEILKGDERYPHVCPRCGGKAYVGLFSVDCMVKCPS